jgi:hypothetical protein
MVPVAAAGLAPVQQGRVLRRTTVACTVIRAPERITNASRMILHPPALEPGGKLAAGDTSLHTSRPGIPPFGGKMLLQVMACAGKAGPCVLIIEESIRQNAQHTDGIFEGLLLLLTHVYALL